MVKGKVVVITGSNAGIGKETAVRLAAMGATTVLACRDREKGAGAAREVAGRSGNDAVHVVPIDLADLASVQAGARTIERSWDRLDVLVNNAGGIWTERRTTAQGFEQTLGVNHLGHFYLTLLLLDRLVASAPSRLVNVASFAHHFALRGMRWDDLQSEHGYRAMDAYSQSKLANILSTRRLASLLDPSHVTVNAAHPGPVRSRFGMDGDMRGLEGLGNRLIRPFEISAATGAKTSVFLAADPAVEAKTGGYWVRRRPGHMSRAAKNDAAAVRLWDESERMLSAAGFRPEVRSVAAL
jgi:NAD(P)-dependent dehydrogenase (short-subunit alcohol dehydrogenase family)